jgi:hypothetical protein
MFHSFLFLIKRLTFVGVVCLASLLSAAPNTSTPDELWSASLTAFKENRPQQACQLLKDWIVLQKSRHVQSSEAYFNLAICSWQTKDPASSVVYGLKSLQLRQSPLKKWSDLQLIHKMQKQIGMRDNLPARASFFLRMLFPKSVAYFLFSLGFWIALLSLALKKFKKPFSAPSLLMSSVLFTIGVFIVIFQKSLGPIGVVSNQSETNLVAFDKTGAETKLATLPGGAILELGATKNEFVQVLKPVGGWIKTEKLEKAEF